MVIVEKCAETSNKLMLQKLMYIITSEKLKNMILNADCDINIDFKAVNQFMSPTYFIWKQI